MSTVDGSPPASTERSVSEFEQLQTGPLRRSCRCHRREGAAGWHVDREHSGPSHGVAFLGARLLSHHVENLLKPPIPRLKMIKEM